MVRNGFELLRIVEELHEESAIELFKLARVDLSAEVGVVLEDLEIEEILQLCSLLAQLTQRLPNLLGHLDIDLGHVEANS